MVYFDVSPREVSVLRKMQIDGFRCLKSLRVDLKPLTVLIGANDSGKSAFLYAVQHLIQRTTSYLPTDHWLGSAEQEINLWGKTDQDVTRTKSLKQGVSFNLPKNEELARTTLQPVVMFQLPSSGVIMDCDGYSQAEESELLLNSQGGRVAALFDFLLRRDRKRFFDLVDSLRATIPGLTDIDIATPNPSRRRVDLVIESGFRLPADLASVGVRMLLFFMALAYHPRPPRTILLEEPETGLHPKRLGQVVQLLRDLSTGKFGDHPAQVILTTHSPYLLDFVKLPEDQVLVFRRNDDGSRTAQPADAERLKSFLDEFMLGEVWFNEEEAGLVAKP